MVTFLLSVIACLLTVISGILITIVKVGRGMILQLKDSFQALHDQVLVLQTEHNNNHKKNQSYE
jgi:uncharacterized protein with PQ loop repeat